MTWIQGARLWLWLKRYHCMKHCQLIMWSQVSRNGPTDAIKIDIIWTTCDGMPISWVWTAVNPNPLMRRLLNCAANIVNVWQGFKDTWNTHIWQWSSWNGIENPDDKKDVFLEVRKSFLDLRPLPVWLNGVADRMSLWCDVLVKHMCWVCRSYT